MDSLQSQQKDFLTRREQLQFSLSKHNSGDPSSQADIYRSLYQHHDSSSYCSRDEYSLEADQYAELYANVVDNMDDSGLNNFAPGALSLCQHHRNESSKWQTTLSTDSFLQNLSVSLEEPHMDSNTERDHILIPLFDKKKETIIEPGPSWGSNKTGSILVQNELSLANFIPISEASSNKPSHLISHEPSSNIPSHVVPNRLSCEKQRNKDIYKQNPSQRDSHDSSELYRPRFTANVKPNVNVSSSKVGGPYANFGQKRKTQNNWNNGKRQDGKLWAGTCEEEEEEEEENNRQNPFKTAKDQLIINQLKKNYGDRQQVSGSNYGLLKRSLGTRRGPSNKFVPPVLGQDSDGTEKTASYSTMRQDQKRGGVPNEAEEPVDERLKGIDPNMIELIKNDIMDQGTTITWNDIAGLEFAKKTIKEIVVWPMLRPDIFTGLRGPPKGLLLFGPPGTGKTLIGKCIASQSKSTFFCISASSLTSKWVGEGEKMVKALFAVARCSQPAVVFIDEVDSLLSQRSDLEHESSRRIKTEFLVQLDGASTASDERLLVIGATNRPQEIDEAARRRFVKRLLIPLPESIARRQIVVNLMSQQRCDLSDSDLAAICDKTDGYSGADMSNLCREAALGPIRSIPFEQMETITSDQVRPILMEDFEQAIRQVRASVSSKDLELYTVWNSTYGSFGQS